MKFKNILISALLISSITFVGCGTQQEPADNAGETQQEQPADNQEDDKKEETEKESQSLNYEVTKEALEIADKNIKIFYPQVKDYSGELVMEYMNQNLKKIVDTYGNNDSYTDMEIDYEITKMDENILSVLFRGTGKMEGIGEIEITQSMNLDMASSGNEITYDNFIKDDEEAKEEVKNILDEKAKAIGLKGLEAEGIRIYFNEENVVFYYMPLDDSAKEFVELSVPMEELEGYVNTEFGETSAS